MVMPRALAVLRLMTNETFVDYRQVGRLRTGQNGTDDQAARSRFDKTREGVINLALSACAQYNNLNS
jgi:hypothetical protein